MARITICKTAQSLMDRMYHDGFVSQTLSNSEPTADRKTGFSFIAEEAPKRNRSAEYYEGAGPTLLAAIRAAIRGGKW